MQLPETSTRDLANDGEGTSIASPKWKNEYLAIEVRAAFARMNWTVESAAQKTGLSISVLNQLRHGRPVRAESLRRFAVAVDGIGAFDKWYKIAQSTQPVESVVERVDKRLDSAQNDLQIREINFNMLGFSNKEKLAMQFLTAIITERERGGNEALLDMKHLKPATINEDEGNIAFTYSLAYLGPDAAGMILELIAAASSLKGHILETDALFRSGIGSIFIRFSRCSEISAKEQTKVLETTKSIIEKKFGIDKDTFRLMFPTENRQKRAVHLFGGHVLIEEDPENLLELLTIIRDSDFNIVNILQRPNTEKEGGSLVILTLEPSNLDKDKFQKYNEKLIRMDIKINNLTFVDSCDFEYLGKSYLSRDVA